MKRRYQPFYCEENVWWLCHELADRERFAVFISNAARQCVLFQQRIANTVVWDYHVVVIATDPTEVWDLDTRLDVPTPLGRYLDQTVVPGLDVLFRVVPSDELFAKFTTDRSHMREPAGWQHPPPSWNAPTAEGQTMNLMRFVDMDDPIAGEVLDLRGLRERFGV